jgi:hypothetical protein
MADWFSQNAPKPQPQGGGDWFAQNAPPTAAAQPEPYQSDLRKVPLVGKLLGSIDENFVTPSIDKMAHGIGRMTGHAMTASPEAQKLGMTPQELPQESRTSAVLGGLSDTGRGFAQAGAIPFIAANPLKAALGIGVGAVTQPVIQEAAQQMGTQPGTAQFAGDAAGVGLGLGAIKRAGQAGAAFRGGMNPPPPPMHAPTQPWYKAFPPPMEAKPTPEVNPIKSPLPSGRIPGTGEPRPMAPPPARQAVWANNPPVEHAIPPPVEPIHQPLPSGRMQWPETVPFSQETPAAPRPMATPKPAPPTLPFGDRLRALQGKADALGYEKPQAPPPNYTPPKAEVLPHPEAVKPNAQAIAQQLADEMRKPGGSLGPEGQPNPAPKPKLTPSKSEAKPEVTPQYQPNLVTHGMQKYDANLYDMVHSGDAAGFGGGAVKTYSPELRIDTTSAATRAAYEDLLDARKKQLLPATIKGLQKNFNALLDKDRTAFAAKVPK